ncbi:hypothetical protein A0H76_2474 [Hepatospora eriocheir]|uniref:Uncharacterized protein n=1 Tax=Hepatospora eriocheir TaxID=1081669 RepID=A0A1X0QF99_9MICR|nr:hypothetical protein A0H76_2474 [Hepatospora eriocheir]
MGEFDGNIENIYKWNMFFRILYGENKDGNADTEQYIKYDKNYKRNFNKNFKYKKPETFDVLYIKNLFNNFNYYELKLMGLFSYLFKNKEMDFLKENIVLLNNLIDSFNDLIKVALYLQKVECFFKSSEIEFKKIIKI